MLTAACLLAAVSFTTAQASIITPSFDPADLEQTLADAESNSRTASSATPPSKSEDQPPRDGDNDPVRLTRNLARPDGNMGSSASPTTGGPSIAPAALPSAAVSLTRDALSRRLATEAKAFLPDPPLDGSLRPPQA